MKNRTRWLSIGAAALVLVGGLLFQQGDVAAASLKTTVDLTVKADLTSTVGLAETTAPVKLVRLLTLLNGDGANQARVVWSGERTLAPSASENLDLAGGGLTDPFGVAFAPVKVRAIIISAASANTNNVVVGGNANSVPFETPVTATRAIQPAGLYVFAQPGLAGVPVTAGTGDIVQVANSGAGTPVTYSIVIIGTGA